MGLFNIFGNKSTNVASRPFRSHNSYADSSSIANDERPYYQPDDYYTLYSYPNTDMERKVITFEERKELSYPSLRGLYVAEILLLSYCEKGQYPKPKTGYPGLWWFEYGIRDVGHALESLERRGYLQWMSKKNSLNSLKVDELKEILIMHGLPSVGKKAELVSLISNNVPESQLNIPNFTPKYELTELGKIELEQNGYVPYMHKNHHSTTEDDRFGDQFNVWSVNKIFKGNDASDWKRVVGQIELKKFGVDMANAEPVVKEKKDKQEYLAEGKEVLKYLKDNASVIAEGKKTPGDGFDEESKGLDLARLGKDKEALVQLYIAIGKKFDAPALYRETAVLLRKYGLYTEELKVIEKGLKVIRGGRHYEDLLSRKEKVVALIEKGKNNS